MRTCNFYNLFLSIAVAAATVMAQEPQPTAVGENADDFLYAQRLLKEGYHELAILQLRQYLEKYPDAVQAPEALRSIGEAQVAIKNFRAAVETFSRFEARYPNHPLIDQVRQQLAEAFVSLQDARSAAGTYQRLAFFNSISALAPAALHRAAALWIAAGDHARGRELLYKFMEDYPTAERRLPAHLLLVESFQKDGEAQRALEEAERLFRSFPSGELTAEAHFVRARLFEQVGQIQLAEEAFNKLLQAFPESEWAAKAQGRLAEFAYARGDREQATQLLQKSISKLPSGMEKNSAILRLVEIQIEWRQYAPAQTTLADFSQTQADSTQLLQYNYARGLIFESSRDFQKAVKAYQECIAFPPSAEGIFAEKNSTWRWPRQRSFLRAAACEHVLQNADGALAYCVAYRKEYPALTSRLRDHALWQEAEIRREAFRDYSLAARLYQQIIADTPSSALVDDAQLQLGATYELMSENRRAIHEYQRLLENYPASEHYDRAARRCRLLIEFGLPDDDSQFSSMARVLTDIASGQFAGNVPLEIGKLALQRHDFEKAIAYFRESLAQKENQNSSEALFHLGKAYALMAERAALREEPEAQAWRDSAAIALTGVINNGDATQFTEDAGVWLARVRFFQRETLASPEKLAQADSTLAQHPTRDGLDFLRLWAAQSRMAFTKGDSLQSARVVLALQKLAAQKNSALSNEASYSLALWRWQSGDTTAALQMCEELAAAARNNPFKPRALLLRAEIFAGRKRHAVAADVLKHFSQEYFYSALADSARQLHVRQLMLAGRYQEALQVMETSAASLDAQASADGLALQRARAYTATQNYPLAIRAYLHFLHDQPSAPEAGAALLAAAQLTGKVGAKKLSQNYAEECLRRFPGSAEAVDAKNLLADLHFDSGQFDLARTLYQEVARALTASDQKRRAAKLAIVCVYKTQKGVVSDAELKVFQKDFPDDKAGLAEIHYAAGEQALANRDFENADRMFKTLRKDFKDTPSGILGDYGLGKSLLVQNRAKDALEVLTEIPRRYPDHPFLPTVYLGLGDFYQSQQQWDNAIHSFNKVIADSAFDSNYRLAVRSMINCYDRLGLWDRALGLLRGYLAKFPDDEYAFAMKMQIGTFLMSLMQFEDAIAHLRKLKPFADAQTEPEIQYYIGKSYMNAGRFELAIPEFLRVKYFSKPTKLPWDVTALYEAGICFMRLKDYEKARELFRRIVREQGAESNFGRFAKEKINELELILAQSSKKDG
jgi:tetratricopeptide (TPR) repeat protein